MIYYTNIDLWWGVYPNPWTWCLWYSTKAEVDIIYRGSIDLDIHWIISQYLFYYLTTKQNDRFVVFPILQTITNTISRYLTLCIILSDVIWCRKVDIDLLREFKSHVKSISQDILCYVIRYWPIKMPVTMNQIIKTNSVKG